MKLNFKTLKLLLYLLYDMMWWGGAIMKEIKYAPNSKLSQLGIDKVLIRDAGKEGKSIMAFGGEKCRFLGVTKPECKLERSVTSQFKEYIDAAKVLLQRGITIK